LAQPMMYAQQEPPEAQSIKSMLHLARLLALVFGILILLGGVIYVAWVAYLSTICSTFIGFDPYCGGAVLAALIPAIYLVISGLFIILVWMQMKSIEAKVNAHQYGAAKAQTLIWMILGFIFGIILGVILLIAYIKFDPLINASRAMSGGQPPQGGQPMYAPAPPQGYGAPPPVQSPPMAPAPAAAVPFCPTCGKPGTYVAQYGRYYCYDDKVYL
ncbi:MAG: hypothetical protein ACREEC_06675, partial [Thermoplasmata archaeon]